MAAKRTRGLNAPQVQAPDGVWVPRRALANALGALTNRSGTITAGGSAQVLMAANADRSYLLIQNPDTNQSDLWIDFDGTVAVQASPSLQIKPGGTYERDGSAVPTGAISIIGPTTAQPYTAKEG